MTDQPIWDVAIIGGGVIGLSCAFELARRRRRVVVIERDQPGSHASRVAAGLLGTVAFPLGEDDQIFPLKLDSLRRYPEYVAKVESIGRGSAGYRIDGTLWVARNADEDAQLEAIHARRTQLGLKSQRVGASQIFPIEPELSAGLAGGLRVDGDVQVDPRRLLSALERAVKTVRAKLLTRREALAGEFDEAEEAWTIQLRNHAADQGTDEDADSIRARNVLVTAGPWCDRIVETGRDPATPLARTDVGPVKGQLLRLRGPRVIDRVVRATNVSIAQRRDGELIVASTKEPEAGWDLTATAEAREELLARASELLPQIRDLDLEEHSVGLRPAVADHMPVIGPVVEPAGRPGLWIATGHFQHGILLAPATAYWLAEAMESGEVPAPLQPYGMERLRQRQASAEAAP